MSAQPVYFQLYSLAAKNYLIANVESPFLLSWGPALSEEGIPPTSLFTLLRYGPGNNYQMATYFGRVLGAAGGFTDTIVAQDTLLPYTPPTNFLTQLGENSRSWHIMPNTVWIPGAADQHFYQCINVTTQKALGADPQSGGVAFVEPNTEAAAFYITQAKLPVSYPSVTVKDYLPIGTSAGATLVCSNFGIYSGPFLSCINNSVLLADQPPTLSPEGSGSDPVLNPTWRLIAESPQVVALTEDGSQNVLFVSAIP